MFENKTQYGFVVFDGEYREYFQREKEGGDWVSSGPKTPMKPISS